MLQERTIYTLRYRVRFSTHLGTDAGSSAPSPALDQSILTGWARGLLGQVPADPVGVSGFGQRNHPLQRPRSRCPWTSPSSLARRNSRARQTTTFHAEDRLWEKPTRVYQGGVWDCLGFMAFSWLWTPCFPMPTP